MLKPEKNEINWRKKKKSFRLILVYYEAVEGRGCKNGGDKYLSTYKTDQNQIFKKNLVVLLDLIVYNETISIYIT